MGCVLFGGALVAGLCSMALGLWGFRYHRKAMREHGRGSWSLYGAVAGVVAVAFFLAAKAAFLQPGGDALAHQDYSRALLALSLVAAAPGAGLLAGAIVALEENLRARREPR